MSEFDPTKYVTVQETDYATVVETDYEGLLAEMTGTEREGWEEFDGPDTGVGVGYHYAHAESGMTAYINVDQGQYAIDVSDADGEEVGSLTFQMHDEDDEDGSTL